MHKKEIKNYYLLSWLNLNDYLITANEGECKKLIQEELKGRARESFLNRIHSRLNKVRADREREELRKKSK